MESVNKKHEYDTDRNINTPGEEAYLEIEVMGYDRNMLRVSLKGYMLEECAPKFLDKADEIRRAYPDRKILFDCGELELMAPKTVPLFSKLMDEGAMVAFANMNQDCYIALWEAGLGELVESHIGIPEYDTAELKQIGEGANGRVYRIDDEIIMKTFKKKESLENIIMERYLTKCALAVGVPCPISFGMAFADGKVAILFEMVKSKSLSKVIGEGAPVDDYMEKWAALVRHLHEVKGDELDPFPRKKGYEKLLMKADSLDDLIGDRYRGKIREILERIDDEEVLLHGDPHPGNIRVTEEGLSFIDLETISTGPEILDMGALRRSLHCDWEFSDVEYSDFMKLSKDQLKKMWDDFIRIYYRGVPQDEVKKNGYLAEIIGDTLSAAQYMKRSQTEQLNRVLSRLRTLIDMEADI